MKLTPSLRAVAELIRAEAHADIGVNHALLKPPRSSTPIDPRAAVWHDAHMTTLQLTTARLVLRLLQPTDREAFLSYRNDPEVVRYQRWAQITPEEAQLFLLQAATATPGPGHSLPLAITLPGGLLIGDCLLQISQDAKQGEISFTLSPLYQGQGYGLEAVTALLEYAFGTLQLHRIIALTDARHTASAKLLRRLGLRHEGHLLQSRQVRGEWRDELLYALLASEWPVKGAS